MAQVRSFGRLADGREVHAITLGAADGLQAEVLTYGAILRKLAITAQGERRELVLALDDIGQYEADNAYVGPVVGRFGNRIARGQYSCDGKAQQLAQNENGNHLHGGFRGTGRQLWQLHGTPSPSSATLALESPAGDEGYPGNLGIRMDLTVQEGSLRIEFTARSDAATPVNLTCHPYFNLGGEATRHWLRIPASRYLPVGPGLIPTGEIADVAGTPFDFRAGRLVQPPAIDTHPQLALGGGYDHCWVVDEDADCLCELRSPAGEVAMKIRGSGPGLQFYSGQYLARSHPSLRSGIALEPQGFPDAPNHGAFPDAILRPGSVYRAVIEYQPGAR
jgi:aldose 1-epimerase